MRALRRLAAFAILQFVAGTPVEAQGVHVALLPASQIVAPGAEFVVTLTVTEAGSAFNAFDAYIGFDPAALTPVPMSPLSQQEGAYFVGSCGSRFHHFRAGADRDTVSDVLLCAGASRTGPGDIYRLRFRASSTPQATAVRFLPGLQFYNGGLFVEPESSTDAVVGIGVDADAPVPRTRGARMIVAPNPARGRATFRIESDHDGYQQLRIVDLQGRTVRMVDGSEHAAGARTVSWDGRDDAGRLAAPGNYVAMLKGLGKTLETRFTLLR